MKDLELWTKMKWTNEKFKKVDLAEFLGSDDRLLTFDHGIKWR